MEIYRCLSYATIWIQVDKVGEDFCVRIGGGEKPHIGCVIMAVPRPSLMGGEEISATSSVLNVTGHKDEEICRYVAEEIAKSQNRLTVCTGGFHVDGITREQIQELLQQIQSMTEELIDRLAVERSKYQWWI